jgi:hypothetical protein
MTTPERFTFYPDDPDPVPLPNDLTAEEVATFCDEEGWTYGAEFIPTEDFTDYTRELIEDCYGFPPRGPANPRTYGAYGATEAVDMNIWPWRHLSFDYKAAAEELTADYTEVTFSNGTTYYALEV